MKSLNNAMTSEQLNDLMATAVCMQSDSEQQGNRDASIFAYAVQVAVLDLLSARSTISELESQVKQLAAENAELKSAITAVNKTAEECELNGDELKYVVGTSEFEAMVGLLDETPATEAYLSQLRNEARAEGVEMFAKHCDDSIGFVESEDDDLYTLMEEQARMFALKLCEGKAGEVCGD